MSLNSSHDLPGLGTEDTGLYGYRKAPPKEVSFLEFVEVSTTDSSVSADLTNSNSSGLTVPTTTAPSCISIQYSPSRPPLPGGHQHTFHYEPLRPPAAILQHHLPPTQSSSISSNNSNSSNSPSPLVAFPEPGLQIPPYPDGYQLLLNARPSMTPSPSSSSAAAAAVSQQSFSVFQTESPHHLFAGTSSSAQQSLLQYASNGPAQYYGCSPASSSPFPSIASNPTYESLGSSLVPGSMAAAAAASSTEGGPLCNEAVISKSSSSDSDTNDSATRLISDSLADISNHHIYLMHQSSSAAVVAGSAAEHANLNATAHHYGPAPSRGSENTASNTVHNTDSNADYKNDALWIQMQSEISKEMREKYLSVNGTSSSAGLSGSSSSSKKKPKKNFTFRRIGCGKFHFVCPLRQSTVRYLVLTVFSFVVLCSSLAMLFCYLRGWWIFAATNNRPYGPDPEQYWWQGTTFYEIFPSSFKDTDGDGFGDFNGITEQVGYLRSLGVSAVRLSSIFAALDYPQRFEHVLDFEAVDPHLGKWADFLKMIDTLHSNQIRVILELNPTMTSDQHQWAVHWAINKTDNYRNFYENKTRSAEKSDHNRTTSANFEEPPTSIDAQSRHLLPNSSPSERPSRPLPLADTQFYFGGGLRLNFTHEPVRAELLKIAIHWLRYVDGLYLTNLASAYLQSNLSGAHSRGAVLHDFLRRLRAAVNELNREKLPGKTSRKILISSSDFVDPFLSGLIKRRRSQDRRSTGVDYHQLKPEFDDLDLDQSALDPLDPTILANLHVMPFHPNQRPSTQSVSSTTPSSRVRLKGGGKVRARKLYSYFDLIHFELNLSPSETDTIRDQVNYVFLNRPADFPTILWSIGSIHRSRIADRLGEERVLATHFLLSMMPGTTSLLYGDEIALPDVYETHTNNKYRGGQLTPMPWSSHSPNGNFSLLNISNPALWMPVHPDYARVNVEKRQSWVKLISDLHHFRLDHLYSDVQPSGRPLPSSTNYLFHYIDSSIVVVEQHFDRRSTSPSSSPGVGGQPVGGTVHQEDFDSLVSQSVPAVPPSTRYRYVLFVNLGNETLIKDFSDKFYFSMTQLATNANRTSEFLIMKALKLDPGEAMIATVE